MKPLSRLLRYRKLIAVKKLRDPHTPLAVPPTSWDLGYQFQPFSVCFLYSYYNYHFSLPIPIMHASACHCLRTSVPRSGEKLWSCEPPKFLVRLHVCELLHIYRSVQLFELARYALNTSIQAGRNTVTILTVRINSDISELDQ